MIKQTDIAGGMALDSQGLDKLKAAAKQNSPQALSATAQQMEGVFVNMMMKSMRQATPQGGLFQNNQTQQLFTSMLDAQLSQKTHTGLADMMIKQIARQRGDNVNGGHDPVAVQLNRLGGMDATGDGADLPQSAEEFFAKLAPHAEEASRRTGIPVQFMLGHAALESGWGKSEIRSSAGKASHNLFGIKAGASWNGGTVDCMTTEYVDGVAQKRVERFRSYDSYQAAFEDYANLLKNNRRYQGVLDNAGDAHGFAYGLQRAGYATDPAYGAKLKKVIQQAINVNADNTSKA
ncbi:flagellar assembly peptidoglycan hydrolase FlgJ [Candidatus Methylospira mobilis]|uniref:Peptidoglycan hydrolase FlgJ n=1 Tax=Candidatus Methylospira mobilis TaxID=1808979 RepID=A0A5Q0BF32_9GAMM|nr:flagellar assembly peptidoglycan hydrolase FlgJ [Candidatus Methylospira mobilis]QFY42440.1 flagellar assembly peptidoglycan hydrolase FlgJ [Candidatus Methylospira mobilis]